LLLFLACLEALVGNGLISVPRQPSAGGAPGTRHAQSRPTIVDFAADHKLQTEIAIMRLIPQASATLTSWIKKPSGLFIKPSGRHHKIIGHELGRWPDWRSG